MKIKAENNFIVAKKIKKQSTSVLHLPEVETALLQLEVIDSANEKYKQGDKILVIRDVYEDENNLFFFEDKNVVGRLV